MTVVGRASPPVNKILLLPLVLMDRKGLVTRALAKAEKYRSYTRWIDDQVTVQRIRELSVKLKRRARAIAKPTERRVRRRAKELWGQAGCPTGRDLEFWLKAEQEFREAEDIANKHDSS
jgi:hypothetical protein